MGVTGNLHNDECLIYIFTKKVENGTPIVFNKTLSKSWNEKLWIKFLTRVIDIIQHRKMYIFKSNFWKNPREWYN